MPAVDPVTNACLPASPKSMASSHPNCGRRSDNGRMTEATMRRIIGFLMAAAVLAVGTAAAQPIRPGTPSILRWTLEQQTQWYPAIETVYRSATVKRGDTVRPLPKAERSLDSLT